MTECVVVDASIAVKWLLPEPDSSKADDLLIMWEQSGARVASPHLLPVEVANAVYQRVRRDQISYQTAIRLLLGFLDTRIELFESATLHTRALEIAARLQQRAVYDAHYLALADLMDCELWTADESFFRAAQRDFPRAHWLGQI